MNELINGNAIKMTSIEIAELVGKRHDNVKRTIETLAKNGVIRLPQIEVSERINNLGFNVQYEHYVFEGEQGIGVSVYREFLLSQQQRAKNNARLANVFKTKHLNIWVSARSAYFNLVSWQSCEDKSLTLEQFEGQPCILAFDLARKLDMNSMARLYTREIDGKTHYYSVAPRFWVPYDTVYSVEKNEDRRTAERFQKWVEMGVLTVTDGAEVDYRYILEEAKAANKISPVSESPIDPFGATGLSHDLADEDLNPITIIQNYTNMSDPMKELEAAIESGRFHHDGNPIMTWCIGNVVGKTIPGNDDVVKPVKEQAENKIDGAVALIMAVARLELAADFCGLFLMTDKQAALPYASAYKQDEQEIKRLLVEAGMETSGNFNEPADHLAIYLELLSHLHFSLGEGTVPARRIDSLRQKTLTALWQWLPEFVVRCRQYDSFGFYAALSQLLLVLVESDHQNR